jgi:hypothetical protein
VLTLDVKRVVVVSPVWAVPERVCVLKARSDGLPSPANDRCAVRIRVTSSTLRLQSLEEQHCSTSRLHSQHSMKVPYAVDNRTRIAVVMTWRIQMAVSAQTDQ